MNSRHAGPLEPDPLFPTSGLWPLAERGGGYRPMANIPGPLRPYSASLGVAPIECGKHDTTATRWTQEKATEESKDGEVVPDTVSIVHTDT
jgi:hypothetical protein